MVGLPSERDGARVTRVTHDVCFCSQIHTKGFTGKKTWDVGFAQILQEKRENEGGPGDVGRDRTTRVRGPHPFCLCTVRSGRRFPGGPGRGCAAAQSLQAGPPAFAPQRPRPGTWDGGVHGSYLVPCWHPGRGSAMWLLDAPSLEVRTSLSLKTRSREAPGGATATAGGHCLWVTSVPLDSMGTGTGMVGVVPSPKGDGGREAGPPALDRQSLEGPCDARGSLSSPSCLRTCPSCAWTQPCATSLTAAPSTALRRTEPCLRVHRSSGQLWPRTPGQEPSQPERKPDVSTLPARDQGAWRVHSAHSVPMRGAPRVAVGTVAWACLWLGFMSPGSCALLNCGWVLSPLWSQPELLGAWAFGGGEGQARKVDCGLCPPLPHPPGVPRRPQPPTSHRGTPSPCVCLPGPGAGRDCWAQLRTGWSPWGQQGSHHSPLAGSAHALELGQGPSRRRSRGGPVGLPASGFARLLPAPPDRDEAV